MKILITVPEAQRGHVSHPEMIGKCTDQAHSLFEAEFDLEAQAIETNDVDGAQGGIRAHQQASPPCGMNDGHKTDEQPRWTPQQINNTIAKSDVAFAVNRTGNLLHRSGICKQGLELYFLAIG